jgi:hypothetical protein
MRTLAIAFLLAVAGASQALALGEVDILGKWCGSDTNYEIGRNALRVTWRSANKRKKFIVARFAFTDVTWSCIGGAAPRKSCSAPSSASSQRTGAS